MALSTIAVFKDGTTIYHTGDTSIAAEMEIYGRLYPVDILLVSVFGQCMMDYVQATEAVRLINPKSVFPIHFDFSGDPEFERDRFVGFCREKNPGIEVIGTEKDRWYPV
jgi:L-ascorbate metabolism protein UlaG (beta-lactamase superfamily)